MSIHYTYSDNEGAWYMTEQIDTPVEDTTTNPEPYEEEPLEIIEDQDQTSL